MHADQLGISGMKAGDVAESPTLGVFIGTVGATTIQEFAKRFVRTGIVQLLENFVDARKEVAGAQLTVAKTPILARHVVRLHAGCGQKIPYLRRTAVDELRPKLNGRIRTWVTTGKDPSANTVARLENQGLHAGATEFCCGGETGDASANHDYSWIRRHWGWKIQESRCLDGSARCTRLGSLPERKQHPRARRPRHTETFSPIAQLCRALLSPWTAGTAGLLLPCGSRPRPTQESHPAEFRKRRG